ncbi:hypothetical protein F5148DRAFT_1195846 [Russula earlei]|uniref:Uncharacterized protein n=1 Tax=Russula earlei TaxID=71964 RepID=A0ACC0UA30_9AGAM|nr:hypothetical protein F5148DRAFT_1195846 [Russula earlei]
MQPFMYTWPSAKFSFITLILPLLCLGLDSLLFLCLSGCSLFPQHLAPSASTSHTPREHGHHTWPTHSSLPFANGKSIISRCEGRDADALWNGMRPLLSRALILERYWNSS